ncbi:SGNH hydrolase-type esterase domain-containing protein [Aspergillus egyptiacus]|nr:SGNH hydrolase-type esterase domain-containing protein [Aspergillus egyptiacus]
MSMMAQFSFTYLLTLLWLLVSHPVTGSFLSLGLSQRQSNNETVERVPLRILPLGASITWGMHSSDSNGYREFLRDQLREEGWEVDMIGSLSIGSMQDNNVEAKSGNTIDQVKAAASSSLPYKPNVVLINAGTNDCRLEIGITRAGERMRSLIEKLISSKDMKSTLVVLSTLIPSGNGIIARHTPAVNEQYRALARTMREEGTSVVLAEMNGPNSSITYPADFIQDGKLDGTHPGDDGYAKMAHIWYEAITGAASQGLIPLPAVVESSGTLSYSRSLSGITGTVSIGLLSMAMAVQI